MGKSVEQARRGDATGDEIDPERRAALRAIAKYSGAAGAAATLTVLSAEQVLSNANCYKANPKANGCGAAAQAFP